MRYSIELKDRIHVKEYDSCLLQKLLHSVKQLTTDAIKTSKRAIQKTAEATGNLIGNKIADQIRMFRQNLLCAHKIMKLIMNQKHQKKGTYLQKKDNKLLMN